MYNTRRNMNRIFGTEKDNSEQNKVKKMYDIEKKNTYNPFLDRDGNIFNKYIDYQRLLDNSKINNTVKKYITEATGLTPTQQEIKTSEVKQSPVTGYNTVTFNTNVDVDNLANLDVATELPKLSSAQIAKIINTHFSNSKVISESDAEGIYNAQQNTGMSALAILGIGALESGWGTSNIANKTNNLWGYGATNSNPLSNAHRYSPVSEGAEQFASEYMKTYYDKYGAKSIYSAGTGNNPGGKGYAYNDDGSISSTWARDIGSIMKKLYNTANSVSSTEKAVNQNVSSTNLSDKVGVKIADTSGYKNSAAKGQCVWYVRGRAAQKLGKDTGAVGNANEMWYNVKSSARLPASEESIKPNTIASYKTGTSAGGAKYGHVIFIEDVIGDTVYYTEGGSSYYKNGTDGVLKTASKQGILNGINSNGSRFGSGLIGFIDINRL